MTRGRSTLQDTDWNEEWKAVQKARRRPDDAAKWDRRAAAFKAHTPGNYLRDFMDLARIEPGESILDMGCGIGRLAIAYAERGHRVIAADFSPAMLEVTRANALEAGVEGVETKLLSWEDNWDEAGLAPKSVDVAIASRSIATDDMLDSLRKLSAAARRRCFITLTTSFSPHVDARMLAECHIPNQHGRDFQYALNILVNDGMLPTCSYIVSERKDTFDDFEDARAMMDKMIVDSMGTEDAAELAGARARLDAWLRENLVENEQAGRTDADGMAERAYRLKRNRIFTWGFVSWDPAGGPTL